MALYPNEEAAPVGSSTDPRYHRLADVREKIQMDDAKENAIQAILLTLQRFGAFTRNHPQFFGDRLAFSGETIDPRRVINFLESFQKPVERGQEDYDASEQAPDWIVQGHINWMIDVLIVELTQVLESNAFIQSMESGGLIEFLHGKQREHLKDPHELSAMREGVRSTPILQLLLEDRV